MKIKLLFFISVFFLFAYSSAIKAQIASSDNNKLTGILTLDSRNAPAEYSVSSQPVFYQTKSNEKSRWLAGLFSLILPGSGEIYAGSYLKGAIFLVVEAAAITTALIYNHKGDSQTIFFQNYANSNWNVAKYAAWTMQHVNDINPGTTVDPSTYKVFRNNVDWQNLGTNTDWSKYNNDIDWNELNRLESDLGRGYTHQLPYPGEQQYYELIGKYPQYSHGWETSNFGDNDYHTLTDQFLWYSHQRGLANEYYQTGSTAVVFIYINHFLSALDAIWTTDNYNSSLALRFRMEQEHYSNRLEFVPTLHMAVNF